MKLSIPNAVSRNFYKIGFTIKKHSPAILVAGGVVGVVSSTVMACKATTKLDNILEESKTQLNHIREAAEVGEVAGIEYTQEDSRKDTTIVYTQTGLKLVKLYAPSVILGAASIASILMSHRILTKRNVALAASNAALFNSFKGYRGRVVERFGEALDKELRYGVKAEEVTETVVDEHTGEVKAETRVVEKADEKAGTGMYSDYARCYDDGCLGWTKDAAQNLMFLRRQQDYANERLKARGYLFLNDVYESLGIPKTRAGNIVGWVYDPNNPLIDSRVDFGIYNIHDPHCRDFVNGYERTLWLDFNVDGNILNDPMFQ